MFQLLHPTTATLNTITSRSEIHGEEKKPAISLGLSIETANTILDLLDPTLRPTFYSKANGQDQLPGVEETTPSLRTRCIASVGIVGFFEGWTLNVDHGIEEREPVKFGGVKVDKLSAELKDGGTCILHLRCGTSDIDAKSLGIVGMKLAQKISITLVAPEVQADKKPTDGGGDLFKTDPSIAAGAKSFEKAVKAELKKDADPSGQAGPWPFPKGGKAASADPVLDAAKEARGLGGKAA